jgi:hypothetical protein
LRCLRWPFGARSCGEIVRRDVYPDPQRLEDISSIREAMRQISLEAQAVVELLDVRMEDRMYAASLSLYSLYLLKQARNWTLIRIGIQGRRTVMRCR